MNTLPQIHKNVFHQSQKRLVNVSWRAIGERMFSTYIQSDKAKNINTTLSKNIRNTTALDSSVNKIYNATNFDLALKISQITSEPDIKIIKGLLHVCRKTGNFQATDIWNEMKRRKIKPDLQCFGMLAYICSKAKDSATAQELWRAAGGVLKPGIMDCTQLIQAQSLHPNEQVIASIWKYMETLSPDAVACVCMLNACRNPLLLPVGMAVHTYIAQHPHLTQPNSSCMHAYQRSSMSGEQHLVLYTSLLNMYRQCGRSDLALSIWDEIRNSGTALNPYIYSSLLGACADLKDLNTGKEVYEHLCSHHIKPDIALYNSLIYFYIKCGNPFKAISIWQHIQNGKHPNNNIYSNINTYTNVLIACGDSGALHLGKSVHSIISNSGLQHDPTLESTLIKMYSDCGSIEDAFGVFMGAKSRGNINVIVWTTMIHVLGQHGQSKKALDLFYEFQDKVPPNAQTFTAVLTACSHTKLVDRALEIYNTMQTMYGVTLNLEHHNALVDVFARAGRLQEAEDFANSLSSTDIVTWKTILGACCTHHDIPRAERVAERALEFDSQDAAVYVLLANIYSSAKQWEASKNIRELMEQQGIKKAPGKSWIEVNGKISYFLVNDKSHPQSNEIYEQLNILKHKLKKEGFSSDTCYVMHDVAEEQKEELIWYHSEKLALAYGLLKIPAPKQITIIKNLRVCGDCHTALEYVSKVCKRDIVVRDANRFHHFRNGKCSCNGYF